MYTISNPIDYLSLLGTNIFYGCESLDNILLESEKKSSCVISNNISIMGESVFENCQSIDDVFIDISSNILPKNTFKNCYSLEKIYFDENIHINTISESAFENCKNMNYLNVPYNLHTIGYKSFSSCSKLDNLIFNNNISNISIHQNAFDNCSSLSQNNSSVVFTNNLNVKNYFNTKYPNTKHLSIEHLSVYKRYFYIIGSLFNFDYVKMKTYFYPAFDVKLTTSKQTITTELIDNSISTEIIPRLRNLLLQFIFEVNKSYNSFVTNNNKLKLSYSIGSNTSYKVTVYNSDSRNIDTSKDIKTTDFLAVYGLINRGYNELLINNFKVRILKNNNGKVNINYSSNDFVSSTTLLTNGNNNTISVLTNYNIVTGDYDDYFVYKNANSGPLNVYLDWFNLNITSTLSDILVGQQTLSMTADAYAKLDVPLSTVINTFMYWSDAVNADDLLEDGLKFKVVNSPEWQNVYLGRAMTDSSLGGIGYFKPSNNVTAKNEIKYDFLRYLAKKIFKTVAGVDIFKNNDQVSNYIENTSKTVFINKLVELENLGEFMNVDASNNISRIIFKQIINDQPERISPNDGDWTPMHLYAGDVLYIKLTINPEPNQHKLLNKNSVTPIESRSYLIGLNMVSG